MKNDLPNADSVTPHGYLLDENLPAQLRHGFDVSALVIHASDLGPRPSDTRLWAYAREHALVIVTKDADFTNRVTLQEVPPPWVVQLCCGNLLFAPLRAFMKASWPHVERLLPEHKLIRLYLDHIEAISTLEP